MSASASGNGVSSNSRTWALPSMKPWLKPYITLADDGPNVCYLIANESELLRCKGKTVPILRRLLPLLDGTRTVLELREQLGAEVSGHVFDELLKALAASHVITDVSASSAQGLTEGAHVPGLLTLLSQHSDRPIELANLLRAARLVIVGNGPLCLGVAEALARLGVQRVVLVAEPGAPSLASQERAISIAPAEALNEVVSESQLGFGVQDGEYAPTDTLQALNEIALAVGVPWIQARLTMQGEAWIGPIHASGAACFECFRRRLKGNLRFHREQALVEARVKQGELVAKRLEFAPFRELVASSLAIEALKFISGLDSGALVGRCRITDLFEMTTTVHSVLRHPFCPVCVRPTASRVYPWDPDDLRHERLLLDETPTP